MSTAGQSVQYELRATEGVDMADDSQAASSESGSGKGGGILSILKGGFPIKGILKRSEDKIEDKLK